MRIKEIANTAVFLLLLLGFLLTAIWMPDRGLSYSERRRLEQKPTITLDSIITGEYMKALENYGQDQFPLREEFRRAKAWLRVDAFGQLDSNGIYLVKGSAVKIEKDLKQDEVLYCADKINEIYARYLQGMNVYCGIIPDKHYFAADAYGRPQLDYSQMMSLFKSRLSGLQYVDLFDTLTLTDYYHSDAHWRQEALGKVRERLAKFLGIWESLPSMDSYTLNSLHPFSGVYLGQSALSIPQDSLCYLTNPVIDAAIVESAELEGKLPVYAPEKLSGIDGYDVFLHGAQAFLTLENPLAETERELIIFRDSFGSSLAPLLLDGYRKITLIDLRYVSSSYLDKLITFDQQDVLFLYSVGLVNSGRLLR